MHKMFSLLDCLFITSATAILSDIKIMFLFAFSVAQMSRANTIGNHPFTAISLGKRNSDHSAANHLHVVPNTAANPNEPEAF